MFNPYHFLTYHQNNFLSSPQGKEIIARVFGDDHPVSKAIATQLAAHDKAIKAIALGDETPLIPPPQDANMPQPAPAPQNPLDQTLPGLPNATTLLQN